MRLQDDGPGHKTEPAAFNAFLEDVLARRTNVLRQAELETTEHWNTNEHNPGQNIGNKKDKEGRASCLRKCAIIYLSLPVSLARTPSALARVGLERPPATANLRA